MNLFLQRKVQVRTYEGWGPSSFFLLPLESLLLLQATTAVQAREESPAEMDIPLEDDDEEAPFSAPELQLSGPATLPPPQLQQPKLTSFKVGTQNLVLLGVEPRFRKLFCMRALLISAWLSTKTPAPIGCQTWLCNLLDLYFPSFVTEISNLS